MSDTTRTWVIDPSTIKARQVAAFAAAGGDMQKYILIASEIVGEDVGELPISEFMALSDALNKAVEEVVRKHAGKQFASIVGSKP